MGKKDDVPITVRLDPSEAASLDAEVKRRGDPHTKSSVIRELVRSLTRPRSTTKGTVK